MNDEEAAKPNCHTVPFVAPIERIARALCVHERRDPDLMIRSEPAVPSIAEEGIPKLGEVEEPLWKEYVEEAARFIVTFHAFMKP